MPLSYITGAEDTLQILQASRKIDMADQVALLEPDAAPLTVLTKRLRKKVAIDPKFQWMEDERPSGWDYTSQAEVVGATTIHVTTGAMFAKYDLVKVPRTAEIMRVQSVSSNVLTVIRAFGETAAVALNNAEPLLIIGKAYEEYSSVGTLKTTIRVGQYNYTQIFRLPFGASGTEMKSEQYGGDQRSYQRNKKGIEHLVDIERAFLFGERNEDTTNGVNSPTAGPIRSSRGLLKWITTNVTNQGGLITEVDFEAFLRTAFRYGGKKKTIICSPLIISAISQWAQAKIKTLTGDETYGIAITRYTSPHGVVNLIKSNLLELVPSTATVTANEYAGYAFVVDTDGIAYRYLKDRDTHLNTNIQAPDVDGYIDEYLTECGLHLEHERRHATLKGVTG